MSTVVIQGKSKEMLILMSLLKFPSEEYEDGMKVTNEARNKNISSLVEDQQYSLNKLLLMFLLIIIIIIKEMETVIKTYITITFICLIIYCISDIILRKIERKRRDKIKSLVKEALITDGDHHKQWYIEQIAVLLDIEIIYARKGIAP